MNGWKEDKQSSMYFPEGTKVYRKKDIACAVSLENGLYHISLSCRDRDPTYYEIKDARYTFCPHDITMAQIFPPTKDFVNIHEHCFHLYQIIPQEFGAIPF